MAGPVIDFDVQTGFDPSDLQSNVRKTLQRRRKAFVYANGPSARQAPKRWPSVALNGAIGLFQDDPATYWVACDPQALVAGFLSNGAAHTYMPASKCHPDVFMQLECLKASYIPWRMDDCSTEGMDLPGNVPCAVSVTICTIGLLYQLGFHDLTIYGWDCCYIDGKDHAIPQGHSGNDVNLRIDETGQEWHTTTTWAAEVEDAANYIPMFPDMHISIEGPGMVGAILRHKGII